MLNKSKKFLNTKTVTGKKLNDITPWVNSFLKKVIFFFVYKTTLAKANFS